MSRILVIVPAFNEEASIARVVTELRAVAASATILVIDDDSIDATMELAQNAGARVVRMPYNCGIGATIQTGLTFAMREQFDTVVRVDGDGQHDPRDVPKLLAALGDGRADFVLGSRYIEGDGFQASPSRRVGILWFCAMLRFACGLRVTDPTSGFWAANRRVATLLYEQYSADYPEVDSLVYLTRHRCRLEEVPVVMRARDGGHSSIEGMATIYYMIKVTVALLASRMRRPRGATGRNR